MGRCHQTPRCQPADPLDRVAEGHGRQQRREHTSAEDVRVTRIPRCSCGGRFMPWGSGSASTVVWLPDVPRTSCFPNGSSLSSLTDVSGTDAPITHRLSSKAPTRRDGIRKLTRIGPEMLGTTLSLPSPAGGCCASGNAKSKRTSSMPRVAWSKRPEAPTGLTGQ